MQFSYLRHPALSNNLKISCILNPYRYILQDDERIHQVIWVWPNNASTNLKKHIFLHHNPCQTNHTNPKQILPIISLCALPIGPGPGPCTV